MIYFAIRHKATGEYMPLADRGKGYSWWNPGTAAKFKGAQKTIRLVHSRRVAEQVIRSWVAYPNGRYGSYQSYDGEWCDDIDFKDDGRKKEDLEVVEVSLEIKE